MIRFFVFFVLFAGFSVVIQAQANNFVFVEKGYGTRSSGCALNNAVLDKKAFIKLKADTECAKILPEEIDFLHSTLVTYGVHGDCKMSVSSEVLLDRSKKQYVIHLSNYWGRCRAGGAYSGWMLLDKIPDVHTVKFKETKIERQPYGTITRSAVTVISSEISLNGCVQLGLGKQKFISSADEYLSTIRKDAQKESCQSNATNLDFEQFAYIGISLNSGYCRRPAGLSFKIKEYGGSGKYVLDLSYRDPMGQTCRALSKYDLWIQVQNPKTKYEAVVRVN